MGYFVRIALVSYFCFFLFCMSILFVMSLSSAIESPRREWQVSGQIFQDCPAAAKWGHQSTK